jgi:HEAT repeat protein
LVELGGPSAERAIAEIASSPEASSRLLAVQALGQKPVPNAATTLETLAHDQDVTVARDALRVLAGTAPARALPLVEDAMRSPDRSSRLSALSVASSLDADPQARILVGGVHDADPVIVSRAASQLARLGGSMAESALVDLLTGPSTPDSTKRVAAGALSEMGGQAAQRFRDLISRYEPAPTDDSEGGDTDEP